jgi:hypothetical protein
VREFPEFGAEMLVLRVLDRRHPLAKELRALFGDPKYVAFDDHHEAFYLCDKGIRIVAF